MQQQTAALWGCQHTVHCIPTTVEGEEKKDEVRHFWIGTTWGEEGTGFNGSGAGRVKDATY